MITFRLGSYLAQVNLCRHHISSAIFDFDTTNSPQILPNSPSKACEIVIYVFARLLLALKRAHVSERASDRASDRASE